MPIPRYRLRPETPAVYEAIHWTGDNCDEVFAFLGLPHPEHGPDTAHDEITLPVRTSGNNDIAWVDDWILREISTGDFSAEGDEDFRAYYEADKPGSPFTWAQFVDTHVANETTVVIPVNKDGEWTGDVALDLAGARALHEMLGKVLAEVGNE